MARFCTTVVVLTGFPGSTATANAAPLHSGYVLIESQRLAQIATDLDQLIVREIRGRTVLQGLQEILADTGYRLADEFAADPDLFRLYTQPYPGHTRTLGLTGGGGC